MGLCFSSASAPHSSVIDPLYSGSTTTSSTTKSQFSEVGSGSSSGEGSLPRPLPLPLPFRDGPILKWPNLKVFSFEELKCATKNFRPDTFVGEGDFGLVYKGWLDEKTLSPVQEDSGMPVAIKTLDPNITESFQAWQSEVNFLGRLSHPNLVKLLGYCWDEDKLLLVYEFVARGSLETHLFKRSFKPLSWNSRLKIAIGAARGLAFLHASERLVIYRDLKATNILLDGNYNAKISDFGSARLGPSGEKTHVSTRIIGSFGYTAPEYSATGHLYVKSDVYGFGVVLLELLTGMRAFDKRRPKEQHILVEWTKAYLSSKKKLEAVMDDKIKGQYSLEAALQAAQLILKCVEHDHKLRPSMKDVLVALEAIEAIQNR